MEVPEEGVSPSSGIRGPRARAAIEEGACGGWSGGLGVERVIPVGLDGGITREAPSRSSFQSQVSRIECAPWKLS